MIKTWIKKLKALRIYAIISSADLFTIKLNQNTKQKNKKKKSDGKKY